MTKTELELNSESIFPAVNENGGDSPALKIDNRNYPTLLVVTSNGYGKTTFLGDYRKTNRGASGVKTMNITAKTGKPVIVLILDGKAESLLVTTKAGITIRISVDQIPQLGRSTQGVKIIRLEDGDEVMTGTVN